MKYILIFCLITIFTFSCKSVNSNSQPINELDESLVKNDTVRIASDDTTYEIIIIEPGFNAWLAGIARPRGYYSQSFMETRNQLFVQEWNLRVLRPMDFNPNLYELRIDYDRNTDYGYEINYKLYNYFIYFQLTYNQRLSSFIPRI